MILQINDRKQCKGVFYIVEFCLGTWTLTLLTALAYVANKIYRILLYKNQERFIVRRFGVIMTHDDPETWSNKSFLVFNKPLLQQVSTDQRILLRL